MTNILLSVCFLIVISTRTQGYTLHKCCPRHQQLDVDFIKCVNVTNKFYYNVSTNSESDIDPPEVINGTNLPWWFPQDVEILDDDTLIPVSTNTSFLRGNFPLDIKYGVDLPCSYQTTQLFTSKHYLDFKIDGDIVVYDLNKTYPSLTYCVDRVDLTFQNDSSDNHIIKICTCLTEPCIRKCCSEGNILKLSEDGPSKCVPGKNVTEDWKPEALEESVDLGNFIVQSGKLTCTENQTTILLNPSGSHYSYLVGMNGTVHVEKPGKKTDYTYLQYCAEVTEHEDGSRSRNLLYCGERPAGQAVKGRGILYGVLIVIGAVFLSATLVVYTVVPELRNLHGKNLMAHTASFLVAYIALAVAQFNPKMPKAMCVGIGFVIQFSFLAAFFWLNVMCFDISWTFSGLRPLQGSAAVRERKKYLYYSFYAWGSTGLISLFTAVMEFTPAVTRFKPGFGEKSCLFNDTSSTMVYFYIPMALLLITNLGLFLYTAARIIAVRRQTAILHRPGSAAYNKEQQRLILYLKLFLLMGVTWVTEIISWAVGGPDYYWYFTDIINLLRAVFIFLIFCCKRTVFRLFNQRFRKTLNLRPLDGDADGETHRDHTTTKNAVATLSGVAGDPSREKARKISNPITQETEINM